MSVVATGEGAEHAEQTLAGLTRVRLPGALTAATTPAHRSFEAQTGGTLVLHASGVVCRRSRTRGPSPPSRSGTVLECDPGAAAGA